MAWYSRQSKASTRSSHYGLNLLLVSLMSLCQLKSVEAFQTSHNNHNLYLPPRSRFSKVPTTTTHNYYSPSVDPILRQKRYNRRLRNFVHDSVIATNGGENSTVSHNVVSSVDHTIAKSKEQPEQPQQDTDSLECFAKDVKHVLHDLRGFDYDPYIPKHLIGRSGCLSYSKTWTLEDWEFHNSRKRYFRFLLNFPRSRLLKRIMPQLFGLVVWACTTIWIDNTYFLKGAASGVIPQIPLSALGTISTFLAFLLTLRSNQALSRLDEARRLWSKLILSTREMSNLISSFIYPVDSQMAIMLTRHVAIFGWLLKSQLRFTLQDDIKDIVRTMLPTGLGYQKDADYILAQRQKTVAIVTRIRQVIAHLGKQHKLTTAEEIALDHTAHAMSETITSTGRIRASPIPTLYTSHASRLLLFYLFCLPPALHMSGLSGGTTILLSTVVGFAMMGLDEMSHLFEQPFRVIPMYQMSKRSMLAVADALTCRPPPLKGQQQTEEEEAEEDDNQTESLNQRDLAMIYWSNRDISSVSDNLME